MKALNKSGFGLLFFFFSYLNFELKRKVSEKGTLFSVLEHALKSLTLNFILIHCQFYNGICT